MQTINGISLNFTFHYVSILIAASLSIPFCFSGFTFHYVSILMPFRKHCSGYTKILYIPLCLYFNCYHRSIDRKRLDFTFHYVSILILAEEYVPFKLFPLYIPLCLYFNFQPLIRQNVRLSTLHSIMSLF